jgi:hypothetical protein
MAKAQPIPFALRRPEAPAVPRLALNSSDAAKSLSISEPTLRGLDLPRVRVGSRVLYPISSLQAWLDSRAERADDEPADAADLSPST